MKIQRNFFPEEIIEQGSDCWHAWRKTRLMASDAATIMKCNPYGDTWDKLCERRLPDSKPVEPEGMTAEILEYGHYGEEICRHRYYESMSPACFEAIVENEVAYGASIDGFTPVLPPGVGSMNGGITVLEVKTPWKKQESSIYKALSKEPYVPDYIYWQLVHQAQVTDCVEIKYAVFIEDADPEVKEICFPGEALRRDWPKLEVQWIAFVAYEETYRSNKAIVGRSELNKAQEWVNTKERFDVAKKELDTAAQALKDIALGGSLKIGRVQITQVKSSGQVDWKQYVEDSTAAEDIQDIIQAYRKPESWYTKITLLKE